MEENLADLERDLPPASSGDSDELKRTRADNLRLKQELSQARGVSAKALPVMTAVSKLYHSGKEGKAIVEKLLKGEPLSASQETKAEEAAKYLTKEDLASFLDGEFSERIAGRVEEKLYVADSAKEGRRELDKWATEEYGEVYEGLRDSRAFKKRLLKNVDLLAESVDSGEEVVPKKFKDDVFKWAMDQTIAQVKADNPELGKAKKETRSPAEVEAEKRRVSTRSSGSSGETNEIPENLREEVASIRRIGTASVQGRSWSRRDTTGKR